MCIGFELTCVDAYAITGNAHNFTILCGFVPDNRLLAKWNENMKKLIISATLVCLVQPLAALASGELPLSAAHKAEIKKTLSEILKDKAITQEQYAQALVWVDATPCNGVDRQLIQNPKPALASSIAKQLEVKAVDLLQTYSYAGWTIVYVDTHVSDEPYLFYSGDPIQAKHPVTLWSGAATIFETSEIEQWVLQNAPGIPKKLASCFAWHVSLNRD